MNKWCCLHVCAHSVLECVRACACGNSEGPWRHNSSLSPAGLWFPRPHSLHAECGLPLKAVRTKLRAETDAATALVSWEAKKTEKGAKDKCLDWTLKTKIRDVFVIFKRRNVTVRLKDLPCSAVSYWTCRLMLQSVGLDYLTGLSLYLRLRESKIR